MRRHDAPVPVPLKSERKWIADPAGNVHAHNGRTVTSEMKTDGGGSLIRAVVKRPRPEYPVEIYSVGMERVAYVLADKLGLPVPETWLDDVAGHASSVQRRIIPALTWRQLGAAPMMDSNIQNSEVWPLAALFDVWTGNPDRRDVNVVFEPVPSGANPGRAQGSRMWLIDHGQCGLWPANKFGVGAREPDDIPGEATEVAAELDPAAERAIYEQMPKPYRSTLYLTEGAQRAQLLDRIRSVGDDAAIDAAVSEIPAPYFTDEQAEATGAFLKVRRDALDRVLESYW